MRKRVLGFIGIIAVLSGLLFGAGGASANATVTNITVDFFPAGLATDGEFVYAARTSSVVKIDPSTNAVVQSYTVASGTNIGITYSDGFLYTAISTNSANASSAISRIQLSSGTVTNNWATIPAQGGNGFGAVFMKANDTDVFVTGTALLANAKVARIAKNNPSTITYYNVPNTWDLVSLGNFLYVTSSSSGVYRINLTSGNIEADWAATGSGTNSIAYSNGYLFVGNSSDKKIRKVNISDGSIVATSATLASAPYTLSVGTGTVYSASRIGNNVSTLNESDLTVLADPYVLTPVASNVIFSLPFANSLWVNGWSNNKVYRTTLVNLPSLTPATQSPSNVVIGSPFSTQVMTPLYFTPTSYSISPALPAGLSFNTATGQITGTPSAVSPVTTFTITGTDGSTSSTATITFGVSAALAQTGIDERSGFVQGIIAMSLMSLGFGLLAFSRKSRIS